VDRRWDRDDVIRKRQSKHRRGRISARVDRRWDREVMKLRNEIMTKSSRKNTSRIDVIEMDSGNEGMRMKGEAERVKQ
jgi:hypothetical protein